MKKEGGKGSQIRERVFEFASGVVSLHRRTYRNAAALSDLSRQAMRSATSIGASLEEADAAHSRAEFAAKCSIALKEAREVRYWLRLLHRGHSRERGTIEKLGAESNEIIAILTTIVRKSRS